MNFLPGMLLQYKVSAIWVVFLLLCFCTCADQSDPERNVTQIQGNWIDASCLERWLSLYESPLKWRGNSFLITFPLVANKSAREGLMGVRVDSWEGSVLCSLSPIPATFWFWWMTMTSLCLTLSPTCFSCPFRLWADCFFCKLAEEPPAQCTTVLVTACSLVLLPAVWKCLTPVGKMPTVKDTVLTLPSPQFQPEHNQYHRRGVSYQQISFLRLENILIQLFSHPKYRFICYFQFLLKCFRLLFFGKQICWRWLCSNLCANDPWGTILRGFLSPELAGFITS